MERNQMTEDEAHHYIQKLSMDSATNMVETARDDTRTQWKGMGIFNMKAFLILEDGTVFEGTSIGAKKEIISEIVFNTSMTGYLEVLTDPSYAGQAVTMTYPLIGNYGICYQDMESKKGWPDGFIVRELIPYAKQLPLRRYSAAFLRRK